MIYAIKGTIQVKAQTHVVISTASGLSYQVQLSLHTFDKIKNLDETHLLTHLIVKEDSHTLYGFHNEAERELFVLLISISGVGPATARVLLSCFTVDELKSAIVSENISVLKTAKGIGPKAAKRIVLELKDKVLKLSGDDALADALVVSQDNSLREEATAALLALGFNRSAVTKNINIILKENPNISDSSVLIKFALSNLTK